MPRKPRQYSATGIYHVMSRGIGGQPIFRCNEDYHKFIQVLGDCKKEDGFRLYAYCLIASHFHMLLKVDNESLNMIFRRIGA